MARNSGLRFGISFLLIWTLLLPFCSGAMTARAEEKDVSVYVDGLYLQSDTRPIITENRTMLPMRAVFEAIGADVSWNEETRTAEFGRGDIKGSITVGSDFLLKNGEKITLDVPSFIRENRTLIPLRAVAESLDCTVYWDKDRRVVRVVTAVPTDETVSEADEKTVLKLGEYAVSEPEWNLYEAILSSDGEKASAQAVTSAITDVTAVKAYAAAQNMVLPPEYIDGGLCDIALFQKSGKYDAVLKGYNTTDKAFRAFLYDTALCGYVRSLFSDVSEKDSCDYARTHFVRVKHIMTSSAESARKAMEELQNGADFETLIKTYGTDFYDQTVGYIFGEGMRTPAFEKAAFALKEGEISDVVKTPFGYHIIKRLSFDGVEDSEILKICGKEAASALAALRYREAVKPYAESLAATHLN